MGWTVRATPVAQRQVARLRGPRRKAFDSFVARLGSEGCKALDYRLSGTDQLLPRLCVKHLRGNDRALVAFTDEEAWVLLVGPHDRASRLDVYDQLYAVTTGTSPESPRTKPPCCKEADEPPVLTTGLIDDLVRRTRALRA